MTEEEKAINDAIVVIGKYKKGDNKSLPTVQLEKLAKKVQVIATILSSGVVKSAMERFNNDNEDSCYAQEEFNRIFNRANIMVFVTGVFITLVLTGGILLGLLQNDTVEKGIIIGLCVAGIVAGGLATRDLFFLRQGRFFENWMSKRSSAEASRLHLFDVIVNAPVPADLTADNAAALIKLECFRKYQLDVQSAYYKKRGTEHRRTGLRTLSWNGWALAGTAIAAGLTGVLITHNSLFSAVAAVGMIFSGFGTFVSSRAAVYQNQRIAELYDKTWRVLDSLYKRLDDVRKAVYSEGEKPLLDFVKAVHEELSIEQKQWNEDLSKASDAFVQLDNTLKASLAKIDQKPKVSDET